MSKQAWERAAGKVAKLVTVSAIAALAATTAAQAEGSINGYSAAQASFGQPAWGQQPAYAHPTMMQPQIHGGIPATAQTFAPGAFPQQTPIFANTTAMGVTYGPPSYTPPEGFDPKMASSSPLPSHMIQGQQAGWAQGQLPNPAGAPIYGGWGQPMQPATMSQYAPAEPSYAPAEPLRPNYTAAAPAQGTYEAIGQTQAASSAYSYEMAPATTPTYVGQSQQIAPSSYATAATASDPYQVVIGQQQAQGYEMGPTVQSAPAYTNATTYGAQAPAYEPAPAYQPAPAYEPAPAYQTAPAYDTSTIAAPTYYDQSASTPFSSGHGHFVQVGAFRNIARAERLVRKLQSAGEQPIITQANVRGKLYHRVRVPAADQRDASYVRDRIRGLGYYEARLVRG